MFVPFTFRAFFDLLFGIQRHAKTEIKRHGKGHREREREERYSAYL